MSEKSDSLIILPSVQKNIQDSLPGILNILMIGEWVYLLHKL